MPVRVRALVALLALVGLACAPAYPGFSPEARQHTPPQEHRTVLIAGDSIMFQIAPWVRSTLADRGLPATVVDRSLPASSQCDTTLAADIAAYDPDLIVASYIGNVKGRPFGSGAMNNLIRDCTLRFIDAAGDVPVYWVIPATVVPFCWWDTGPVYDGAATWYVFGLPAVRNVELVDWRSPLSPGATYATYLDFGGYGSLPVKEPDCMHFTALGARLAGEITAGRIQAEW